MEPSDADVVRASVAQPELFATIFRRHHRRIWAYLARTGGRESAGPRWRPCRHVTASSSSWSRGSGSRTRRSPRSSASSSGPCAIGAGECSGFDLAVTAGSAAGSQQALDQVELALTGPGGPLEPEGALVTGPTVTADEAPHVAAGDCPDDGGEQPDVIDETGDARTYATPRDALASYVATQPRLAHRGYHEIALADGSFAYAYPDAEEPAALVRVAARYGGWSVSSFDSAGC